MSNTASTQIPPKFIACMIDITGHFSDNPQGLELVERCGGKVYYSGFFDDSVNTHLCSAEKMVYVEVIGLLPEGYPEDTEKSDALHSELLDLLTPDDSGYYGRNQIERMKVAHPNRFTDLNSTFDDDVVTNEQRLDEVRESLQGSPAF